jgi:threonine dehydrogenase-like Zn-dependent dehydrogenase
VLRAGTHVVTLPDAVTDRMAVTANCALATMVHAVEKLRGDEQTVWIQGGGLLGLFGAALLRDRGVPRVIVTEPDSRRRAVAGRLGALVMPVEAFLDRRDLADGGCDAVIEVAGDPEVVASGTKALRPGGVYVWVGMVHPATTLGALSGEQVVRRCMRVQGVYNYAPRHLERAIEFLARCGAGFPFDEVVSPALPLKRLNEAFALALERRWARVSIDCSDPDFS